MTRSFTFTKVHVGWVSAEIKSASDVQIVTASYLSDAIRDFADALASLVTTPTATCGWQQEPGEFEWHFNRSDDSLIVTICDSLRRNEQPLFQCSFHYRSFCRDVLDSLCDLRNTLGLAGFEKEWGYPFPTEASRKLENAVTSDSAPQTA